MKYILLILLGGSAALSVGNHHHLHFKSRGLDTTVDGHDKNPRGNLETATSPSPTGKETQCTGNSCVVDPDSIIKTITATTTLTSVVYYTSTVFNTVVSTNHGVTTKLVTSTVTRNSIDVATVTNYVTSTKIAKRFQSENPARTQLVEEISAATPAIIPSPEAPKSDLGDVVAPPKRDVTSYIFYDITSVWITQSSVIFETSTIVSQVDSTSTQFATVTSTLFNNAKSTTTIVSTVVETSTQVATSAPSSTDPVTTETSNTIASHERSKATTITTTLDDKSINELQVATSAPTTVSSSSPGSKTATSTSSTTTSSSLTGSTPATSIPTSPVMAGSTTSSSTPTSSHTSSGSSSGQGSLSTGAKAGIGTGAAAGGLALLGVMIFYAVGKRRRPASLIADENMVVTWTPPEPPRRYSHLDNPEVSYPERAAALAHSMETMGQATSTHDIPGYPQPSTFGPPSRSVSPSVYSETIEVTSENMDWYMEPNTDEIPRRQSDELHLYPKPIQPPF
ncbi:hypothetical protein GGR51DRAFT_574805 [Nemania sp. FL0031]|nr:hypothetical protein GGR51DRAFT_574805 [Nemania sp. FL0031]